MFRLASIGMVDCAIRRSGDTGGVGDMTIARKLYLLIVAVVLGVIMQAVVGLYQSHRIASSAGYSATDTIPSVLALNGATDAIYGIRLNIARYVIEPTAREKTVANMAALHQKAQDFFDQFERCCISDDTDRRMLEADRRFFCRVREAPHGHGRPRQCRQGRCAARCHGREDGAYRPAPHGRAQ